MITLRVIAFLALIAIILGIAAAGIAWYARSSYFVGLRGDRVTIFQGRPGGVLWFHPTIAARTNLTTAGVLPHEVPRLRSGQEEPTLSEARLYVAGLVAEANRARAAQTPSTTAPSTTTVPGANGPPPTT